MYRVSGMFPLSSVQRLSTATSRRIKSFQPSRIMPLDSVGRGVRALSVPAFPQKILDLPIVKRHSPSLPNIPLLIPGERIAIGNRGTAASRFADTSFVMGHPTLGLLAGSDVPVRERRGGLSRYPGYHCQTKGK
ncbi:hypothetical protein EB093_04285 [bacterium]|nr:hypothetical protein [bacterium]